MHTPKEEVERVLAERSKKIIEETHKRGFPVRTVDEVGVYDLYSDGRKEYVKLYEEEHKK